MKNLDELLDKQNWIWYLELAEKGGTQKEGIANGIVKMITEALAISRVSNRRELLRDYEKFTDSDQNMDDAEYNISCFLGE